MPRVTHLLACLALLTAALGATSSSVGAVTWHNSGDTAFTATGPFFQIDATSFGFSLNCFGGTTVNATAATGPATGAVWSAMHVRTVSDDCRFVQAPVALSCTSTFTALLQSGTNITGTLDTTCDIFANQGTTLVCHLAGQRPATYRNPTGSAYGSFTVPASSSVIATNGQAACPFGPNTAVPWTHEQWTITAASGGPAPHTGPILTRTP
jgi:hypothetical protein